MASIYKAGGVSFMSLTVHFTITPVQLLYTLAEHIQSGGYVRDAKHAENIVVESIRQHGGYFDDLPAVTNESIGLARGVVERYFPDMA